MIKDMTTLLFLVLLNLVKYIGAELDIALSISDMNNFSIIY
jgi:hypothetical protein